MKNLSTLSRHFALTWPRKLGLEKRQRANYREIHSENQAQENTATETVGIIVATDIPRTYEATIS